MSDIDYSSNYDFNLDPYVDKNYLDNVENSNTQKPVEENKAPEEKMEKPKKKGQGCKMFFIVMVYLLIIELNFTILIDSGMKKIIFIIIMWNIGYNLANKVIGFEKNVCNYLF